MKTKVNLSISVAAMMLFVLSATGHAMACSSDHSEAKSNISSERPHSIPLGDESKLGPEVLENLAPKNSAKVTLGEEVTENTPIENPLPASATASTKDSMVSSWLEARATEEATSHEVSLTTQDEGMVIGGGWCNFCGCWLHHGLDPNGTPQEQIGHPYVCTGGASGLTCYNHYYTSCISTG